MTWSVNPKKFGENVRTQHRKLCQRLALRIDQGLVTETPVDTGRARSNWRVGVGGKMEGQIEPYSPGVSGSTAAENTAAAIAQGQTAIETCPDYPVIFIGNNLAYIARLNEGSSAQAPEGFVENVIELAVRAEQRFQNAL